ncbi:MAG: murein transglycosylase A [Candidatus Rifleibacteriota bacterium]
MIKHIIITTGILFAFASGAALPAQNNPGAGYDFDNNGKIAGQQFNQMYEKGQFKINDMKISAKAKNAAQRNLAVLSRLAANKSFQVGNLNISARILKQTGKLLAAYLNAPGESELQKFTFYQIEGEDGKGNVHFTGYFTPVLKARKVPNKYFKYPLYAMPTLKKIPSRRAIDNQKALVGKGLELAYTSSLLDNYFLHVQGSGLLDFGDENLKKIGYAGQNGHSYKSLGKMLVSTGKIPAEKISLRSIRDWFDKNPDQLSAMLNRNPSYTFFKWRKAKITGAAGVELTPMHSVAVDDDCIPYGACLLAEVPELDEEGQLKGHRFQFLFAHDTGGAIRGPGHLDLYHGFGRKAGDKAGDMHHYGRLWLLLAK